MARSPERRCEQERGRDGEGEQECSVCMHTHTHTHTPERNSRTTEEAVLGVGCLRNVPSSFGRAAGAGVAQGRYMPPCQALP